ALVNGKRSVYIPVTKRADASTWDVVQRVKAALPEMQAAIPEDIKVSYEFDQSGYVINALKNLLFEGGLGALLTGLMVLLFLGDRRGALIVVLTIPIALLTSATLLFLTGQTINIMTLGGLALSVGILVDEATVTIENIHRHLEMGKPRARAIADASREIALPKLLILLSILAVTCLSFNTNDPLADSIKRGKEVYTTYCVACHQADGKGLDKVFPPLAKSDYLMADKKRSIKQVIHGATEPITVNGVKYTTPMMGFPSLTDQEVADVLNYVRNSWGNKGDKDIVKPEEVKKARSEKKKN
ncbi:MAG: efflux RND transporter permease subunit, partial [Saprospiraceae bacterium]